jgi:hypothetical protein
VKSCPLRSPVTVTVRRGGRKGVPVAGWSERVCGWSARRSPAHRSWRCACRQKWSPLRRRSPRRRSPARESRRSDEGRREILPAQVAGDRHSARGGLHRRTRRRDGRNERVCARRDIRSARRSPAASVVALRVPSEMVTPAMPFPALSVTRPLTV